MDYTQGKTIEQVKADMIAVGKHLGAQGLMIGRGGNYSARISDSEVLITASGFAKYKITPEQISRATLGGELLEGLPPAGDIRMHMKIYNMLPDIRAIVHCHPPVGTGFAMTDYDFSQFVLPEVILDIGGIEMTDFGVPTTPQVPAVVQRAIEKNPGARALILKGHGVMCYSERDVEDAGFKVETLEATLKSILVARNLGHEYHLSGEELAGVLELLK